MQRATRNRGNNNNTNNPNLDSGPSSITTPTTFLDQQRRGQLTGVASDQHTTISLDSEDDPATECSFEYDDDGFLRSSINESDLSGPITARGGGVHRVSRGDSKSLDDDKSTTLRGLERLSTETEEFAENESGDGPEDIDLESFKRVYMTDFVIPEEPDKESAAAQLETQSKDNNSKSSLKEKDSSTNSEASKWRRRFRLDERLNETIDISQENERNNNNHEETVSLNKQSSTITTDPQMLRESDLDKPMSISDIEQFVQSTCDQVMAKVRAGNDGNETDESESVPGSGIFKIRPGLKCDNSLDSRISASTDATLSTIEIPTITITEDQLDDSSVVLSEATLRDEGASDYEGGEISQDGGSNKSGLAGRASALKFKVKKLGSKVKDIFKKGATPEVSPSPSPVCEYIDIDEEKRRRKEEEKEAERKRKDEADRRKRDEELEKRALEMERKAGAEIAKERERLRKEEAKRQKEEEKRRKEGEERLRKEEEKARKEEEKTRKEEEKKLKAEEKKRREEEEKKKKEEEKMKKMLEEEEKRKIQEEEERKLAEEERKRQIAEEEEARKRWAIEDAEKRRRWIAEQAEQTRIKFEEEMERKRKQKILDEEEAKRRRQREADEEEKRRKREIEEEEKRKQDEEKMKARETLKRKLEGEAIAGIKRHEDKDTNLDGVTTSIITVIESDHPYYGVDGTRDDIRRASSPSLASGQASVGMSKSASQATIMITSPQSNRDKRSPSRDEETFGQAGESEGDIDPSMGERKRKKMRKRLRDTKNKLINFKSKALESLPSMSSLKSKVKEILPVSRSANAGGQVSEGGQFNDDDPAYGIHREQKIFSEYRKRYPDSENEFFSDSELVESRKSTLKAMVPDLESGDMYDDMDTTVDRVQMLLSPINSPLRPPRKSDYGSAGGGMGPSFHTSEPNISRTGTPKKPKRAPPPRPPPPEKDPFDSVTGSTLLNASATGSTATSIGVLEEIDLTSSNRDLSESFGTIKKEPEKIPASIYYRKVVRDWRERHSKKMGHEIVSASSPNLETYQRPPRSGRHPPCIPPLPLATVSSDHPRPIPRRRLSRTGLSRQKLIEQQPNDKGNKENSYDGYDILPKNSVHLGLPPLPPPRGRIDRRTPTSKSPYSTLHRRQLQLQQQQHQRQVQHDYLLTSGRANLATDGLYWKPFSWKTGRCRSLTELYIRKRTQPNLTVPSSSKISELGSDLSLNQEPIERSLSYRLMSQYCSPPRPPPPTIRTESPSGTMTELVSPNKEGEIVEPIYSTINRSKKLKRNNGLLILEESNGDNLIQSRPLPAPPLPPRSKRKNSGSRSRSNSPYLSLTNSSVDLSRPDATLIRPVSPFSSVGMVDVSVETGCQLVTPSPLESKECQTSLENIPENKQISETTGNNLRAINDVKETQLTTESPLSYVDDDFGRQSITPTPTIVASGLTQNQISIRITPEREVNLLNENKQLSELSTISNKRTRLSSSSSKDSSPPLVIENSGVPPLGQEPLGRLDDERSNRTLTSYYDAEECDTDMDTFNDLDSLSTEATATLTASTQFHSVYSEPLTTVSSSTTTATYDTDEADSKTMEIPCPLSVPVPSIHSENEKKTDENVVSQMVESQEEVSSNGVPLVAEHVTIEEDSEDDMYQPRVASPSEMRAYISRRQMRPDSMDASDSEW